MNARDDNPEPRYENPENVQRDELDGSDMLMAVILDEPLPAWAQRDAALVDAHRVAIADVAVLREQLALIGDALTVPGEAAADEQGAGASARRRPHSPRRRTAKVVLGGLVAAGAAGLVLGMGWLVTQGEGVTGAADGSVAADSKEAGGVLFGSPRYLACARLVAEGSVTEVEQVPGATGTERVTLEVSRYYQGGGEVTFLRYTADGSPLRAGDRVLVGMPLDGVHPDRVVVGEPDIARERALITASLPESRTLTCD
ncbi:hypothetical protein ABZ690_07085 [Streptomyces sp. NPDC006967]|uniref:hypothetical protein n=1 Tax=unclassified Streptomyces TaxID=2593676 RepID=UPI0021565372|nr:hypothetical protein [Streptomyces sp. SM1]